MTNFKVGQKVVCIETVEWYNEAFQIYPTILPMKGGIFTILNIGKDGFLEFEEIPPNLGEEQEFDSKYFRPIVYADATQEILSNFKTVEEIPDLTPNKVEHDAI